MKQDNKLRDCQQKGFDLAIKHLKNNKSFRFNMVTGSGKTVLSIKTADNIFKDGLKVVSVHTLNLKKQFEDEIKRHSINPLLWIVNTYQTLRSVKMDCDILIVDEVHQGGQESEGSYKKIIKNLKPKKIISLSATDYNVDDKLFGKEKYCYGLEQASKDKIINECDIITIDTGLNQILSNKDKISKEKLSHIYEENVKRKVDLKSKKSIDVIHNNNIRSALEVYLREEKGNQAILFIHNIEWCEKAHKIANELGINSNYIHSKIKDKEVKNTISSFKRQEFDLLISIRQLREGFDFPYLEVAIDCAPSFTNDGRDFKQKLGRILRVPYGKKKSRYYIINCVNKFSSDLDLHDSLIANVEIATRNDLRTNRLNNREILLPIGEDKGNTKKYSLFVEHTDSFKENGRKNLFELVSKRDPESKKQKLIEMAKNGKKKPDQNTKIGKVFGHYVSEYSNSFDEYFRNKISEIAPEWLVKKRERGIIKKKKELLKMAASGSPRPKEKTAMGKSLSRFTKERFNTFDLQLKNKLFDLAPSWFIKTSVTRKEKLIDLAKKNIAEKPKWPSQEARDFYNYTKKGEPCFDPIFTKKIKSLAPSWF